ncbi:TonB-system energizer ExbB [uncultured Cocleimonas sp.]|uniref:TonB-system energizer ExbB n=1 Tax=uncultured Cocleimonas sp. TaxID=1051587 RepID=UPI002628D590|nr:TonB-system energizer ExbB [uncultured Cocleimonas sp.]
MDFLRDNLDYMVFGVLGLMSFFMLWFVIERYFYFARVKVEGFTHEDNLNVSLTQNLTVISTIAANAPYVGLLGTVLGIIITFYDMGQGGKIDVQNIMTGLALALKATAGGLLVAIPAIIFYNALLRKVDVVTARWREFRDTQNTANATNKEAQNNP